MYIDIDDPGNVLAVQLTEKYLAGAQMGNFTSMTPGNVFVTLFIDFILMYLFKYFHSGLIDVNKLIYHFC